MSVSVTHNLSGPVSVYGTSFIMLAFGRHTVATAMIIVAGTRWPVTNLLGADLDARRAPVGGAPGKAHITNPARSLHHLVME